MWTGRQANTSPNKSAADRLNGSVAPNIFSDNVQLAAHNNAGARNAVACMKDKAVLGIGVLLRGNAAEHSRNFLCVQTAKQPAV